MNVAFKGLVFRRNVVFHGGNKFDNNEIDTAQKRRNSQNIAVVQTVGNAPFDEGKQRYRHQCRTYNGIHRRLNTVLVPVALPTALRKVAFSAICAIQFEPVLQGENSQK